MPIAASVATAILAAGGIYAIVRPARYESRATVVLAPAPRDPKDIPTLLSSFTASGTAGTYVQLLSSKDTLRAAGSPPVKVKVRAIPGTRSVEVKTSSRFREAVQPAVGALLAAADKRQAALENPWDLKLLEGPLPPDETGPGTGMILLATLLLALLGALLVIAVGGRARFQPEPVLTPSELRASASRARLARRGWRYPTRP